MRAAIEPVERAAVGLDRRVELLLDLQHGADLHVNRGVELGIVERRGCGSVLQRRESLSILPKLRERDATNPLEVSPFVGGREQARRLGQDGECLGGFLGPHRQLGAFAQQRQVLRRPIRDEV